MENTIVYIVTLANFIGKTCSVFCVPGFWAISQRLRLQEGIWKRWLGDSNASGAMPSFAGRGASVAIRLVGVAFGLMLSSNDLSPIF